ncbi:MAG: transglutaminase-like cysteine peptidase [Desulfobulbaceae bacterium]
MRSRQTPSTARAALLLVLAVFVLTLCSCARTPQVAKRPAPPPEAVLPAPAPPPEPTKLEAWRQLVRQQRAASVPEKLRSVNVFFNRFDFVEDRYLWGREDYWATLFETLGRSGGDCEDLTIAKYFTLRELDIADQYLRIIYVISLRTNKPHMVLAYSTGADSDPLVLDTVTPDILPVTRRSDLVPVYSFNQKGYWLARQQEGWTGEELGHPASLSRWWSLLQRVTMDGRNLPGG